MHFGEPGRYEAVNGRAPREICDLHVHLLLKAGGRALLAFDQVVVCRERARDWLSGGRVAKSAER
eukprot:1592027-Rhodomonas_salina.2